MSNERKNKDKRRRRLSASRRAAYGQPSHVIPADIRSKAFAALVHDYVQHQGSSSAHGLEDDATSLGIGARELGELLGGGLASLRRSDFLFDEPGSPGDADRHWAIDAMVEGDPEPGEDALATLRTAFILYDLVGRDRDPMAAEMLDRARWTMACEPCQAEYRRGKQEPTRWPGAEATFEPSEDGLNCIEHVILGGSRSSQVSDGEGIHRALEAVVDAFWPDLAGGAVVTTNAETRELMVETLTNTYLITVRAMVR